VEQSFRGPPRAWPTSLPEDRMDIDKIFDEKEDAIPQEFLAMSAEAISQVGGRAACTAVFGLAGERTMPA